MKAVVRTLRGLLVIAAFSLIAQAQNSSAPDANKEVDRNKTYQLAGFEVNGTRLPPNSVIRLSALKVGQKVNYDLVNQACHRITSTGLVSLVDYAYILQPSKTAVVLSLRVTDELPLLPSKVYPPEDASPIWACLQSADPIFTRELPNTRNALGFYATNINRCLAEAGRPDVYARTTVVCDTLGKASEIMFDIRERPQAATRK